MRRNMLKGDPSMTTFANIDSLIIQNTITGESWSFKDLKEVTFDSRDNSGIAKLEKEPYSVYSENNFNIDSAPYNIGSITLSKQEEKYMLYDEFAVREAIASFNKSLTTFTKYGDMYGRGIKNVIFNPPATIVFWNDNTKTVVKANNEPFDWEKGIAMAYVKKMCGNRGNYYNIFRRFKEKGEQANENGR